VKYIHTLVALTLIAGLGYAECTGGLFAIPQALAESIGVEDEELLMSIAPTECRSTQKELATEDLHEAYHHGCDDGASCIEQVRRNAAGIVAGIDGGRLHKAEIIVTQLFAPLFALSPENVSNILERAGPSFHASHFARLIAKRE
jgi:3-oxoacyl-[acyl-carrier-protein] synthase III